MSGLEILSAVSAIASLVDISFKASTKIQEIANRSRDVKGEVQQLSGELLSLHRTLGDIEVLAKANHGGSIRALEGTLNRTQMILLGLEWFAEEVKLKPSSTHQCKLEDIRDRLGQCCDIQPTNNASSHAYHMNPPGIELGEANIPTLAWDQILPLATEVVSSPKTASRKCAIYGIGGVGKTQIALQLRRQYKEESTAVFWMNGPRPFDTRFFSESRETERKRVTRGISKVEDGFPYPASRDDDHFMVCDAGGGTVDFISYTVAQTGHWRPQGDEMTVRDGLYESCFVDESFERFIFNSLERRRNKPQTEKKSSRSLDMWSLGCVLGEVAVWLSQNHCKICREKVPGIATSSSFMLFMQKQEPTPSGRTLVNRAKEGPLRFSCTPCSAGFEKRWDWKRHEDIVNHFLDTDGSRPPSPKGMNQFQRSNPPQGTLEESKHPYKRGIEEGEKGFAPGSGGNDPGSNEGGGHLHKKRGGHPDWLAVQGFIAAVMAINWEAKRFDRALRTQRWIQNQFSEADEGILPVGEELRRVAPDMALFAVSCVSFVGLCVWFYHRHRADAYQEGLLLASNLVSSTVAIAFGFDVEGIMLLVLPWTVPLTLLVSAGLHLLVGVST